MNEDYDNYTDSSISHFRKEKDELEKLLLESKHIGRFPALEQKLAYLNKMINTYNGTRK